MAETLNIFQRMSAITEEITAVAKNLSVGYGSNSYKAVGEADVLAAVKPIEAKHGVYSYPVSREIVESGTLEKETKNGRTLQLFMRIMVTYRFICIDNPASYIDIISYADGVDTQDKAPGKAMTYADKYALLKAYKIITGDDPDQNMSTPSDKVNMQRAKEAYPPVEEMIKFIESNYDADNIEKIKSYYKVSDIRDMTFEQIVATYNRKKKK